MVSLLAYFIYIIFLSDVDWSYAHITNYFYFFLK